MHYIFHHYAGTKHAVTTLNFKMYTYHTVLRVVLGYVCLVLALQDFILNKQTIMLSYQFTM